MVIKAGRTQGAGLNFVVLVVGTGLTAEPADVVAPGLAAILNAAGTGMTVLQAGVNARADSMPVGLSTEDRTILSALQTALERMDDWDESDRAKVNLIVGQAGIAAGAGAVSATVPRVTLASDDPAVVSLAAIDNLVSPTDTAPTAFSKTVASAGTPEALAANGTFFTTCTIIAKKAARIANTGIVYLGVGSGNDTQPMELIPGEIITISAPAGQKYDLNDYYLDVATNADGVIGWFS